jgi:hypothetical protein
MRARRLALGPATAAEAETAADHFRKERREYVMAGGS